MDRRNFLAAVGGALVGAALPGSAKAISLPTANSIAKNFPKLGTIPEIARIDHMIVEGAQKLVVIFRQFHLPRSKEQTTYGDICHAEQSQFELYRAMDHLHDHNAPGFDHVMCEEYREKLSFDYIERTREVYQICMQEVAQRSRRRSSGGFFRNYESTESRLHTRLFTDNITTLARIGGGQCLSFTKGVKILPSGCADLEKIVDKEIEKGDPRAFDYWVLAKREEKLLSMVSESRRLISYVTYGAGHLWDTSIPKWNAENPQRKTSAITLTSNIVKEWEDAVRK